MAITRRQLLVGAGAGAATIVGTGLIERHVQPIGGNHLLDVVFQFRPHRHARDAESLDKLVKKFRPHVLCIEAAHASEAHAREIEEVHSQDSPLQLKHYTDFQKAEHGIARKHKLPVAVLERFPKYKSRELVELSLLSDEKQLESRNAFFEGNEEEALQLVREVVDIENRYNLTREKEVNRHVSRLYEFLVKRFPEFKRKDKIKVLVRYGPAHTQLYSHAKKSDFALLKRDVEVPIYFPPLVVEARRELFGLPRRKDDAELARLILATEITEHAYLAGVNAMNSVAFGNLLAKRFTLEQFRRICKRFSVVNQRHGAAKAMQEALKQEGIKLPMTREEVHAWLEKRIGKKRMARD